jgi:hypothetical protein
MGNVVGYRGIALDDTQIGPDGPTRNENDYYYHRHARRSRYLLRRDRTQNSLGPRLLFPRDLRASLFASEAIVS